MNQILIQDDFFWSENTVTVLALGKVTYFRHFPEIFFRDIIGLRKSLRIK